MRYLFLLLFPSFLFASSEFNLPYDRKAKFLPVEQIVNPKLLKKDPVIIEGLELPEWLDQTIASELAPFGSYRAADLNGPFHDERCSCAHFRIREGQLTVRVPNYFLNPSQRPKVVVLCTAIYKLIHAKGSQLKNGDFLIYLKDGADRVTAPYPILCFAKKRTSRYVLIPDWFSLSAEKVNWLKKNDAIAYEIAYAGQRFAQMYLSEEMTYLYLYEVLRRVLEKCNPIPSTSMPS